MKIPFIIYAEKAPSLGKINTCHSNPKNSSKTRISKYKVFGYALFTHCSFNATKNRHDYYRGKDCMKKILETQKSIQQK